MSYVKIDNLIFALSTKLAKKVWLNVAGAPTKNDGDLIVWPDENVTPNEVWVARFVTNADGKDYHVLIATSNGAAITYPGSTGGNAQVKTKPVNFGDEKQLWAIFKSDDGSFLIESKVDRSAVLDVRGGDAKAGTAVIAYESHHKPSDNQYWVPWYLRI